MTTVSGTLSAAGVSSVLRVPSAGEVVSLSASGTYALTFALQRAITPDESAWETVLGPYSTDDATVAANYTTKKNDHLRVVVSAYTSGDLVYSFSDGDLVLETVRDPQGNVLEEITQAGRTIFGNVIFDQPVLTTNNVGAVNGATISAVERGDGIIHQTVLTLTDTPLTVTDTLAYLGTKIYDFAAGRVLVLGTTASLAFAVTSTRASTINDDAAMDWALGTATASNVSLSSTMVDILPKVDKTLDGTDDAYTTASTGALAASAQFDGTGTAVDVYLNVSFPTTTDIDADGTMTVTGTITITWVDLGDY